MLFGRGDDLMYRCGIISPSGKASVLCCNDISELEELYVLVKDMAEKTVSA